MTIGLLIWLFPAGGYDLMRYGKHYIEARTQQWAGVVASEIPVGSSRAWIQAWADKRSFVTYQTQDRKTVEIVVETIPWHQIVCTQWKIIAEISMESETSVGERVVSMGACL